MKSRKSLITPKQLEIVKLIDQGFTSFEIGEKMKIRENTVNAHRHNVMKIMGVDNKGDLIKVCKKENLLKD